MFYSRRLRGTIEQGLQDDPYAQEAFPALLRQVIAEAEALFDHPLKQYMLFKEFEEKVSARTLDDIPDQFDRNRHAQAYFGVFKKELTEDFSSASDSDIDDWVTLAKQVDGEVETAVAENSVGNWPFFVPLTRALIFGTPSVCSALRA